MITLQALNNNHESRMARKKSRNAMIDKAKPIAISMHNQQRNDGLPIRKLDNKSSMIDLTLHYRNHMGVEDGISIYTYLSHHGMLIISLGTYNVTSDILNLDDDSIHRFLCIILSHLFNFSDFSKDQMFYVSLGSITKDHDGYRNTKDKWYFGKRTLIEQLGAGKAKDQTLYYDGANKVTLEYDLNKLS